LKNAWSLLARIPGVVALLFFASPVYAHSGTGLDGGFLSGLAHPLTGPDHMLAMFSVGLWGYFLRRPLIYLLPMVFPIMMAIGAGVGMLGITLPPVELGIALSVVILGALILGAIRAPIWIACSVVAIFALFHGYAHGVELPSAADPIGYSLGFVFATGSLHVAGIGIGALGHLPRGDTALRGLGGVVLSAGLYFLWSAWS
jgi:urease accessory protein